MPEPTAVITAPELRVNQRYSARAKNARLEIKKRLGLVNRGIDPGPTEPSDQKVVQ